MTGDNVEIPDEGVISVGGLAHEVGWLSPGRREEAPDMNVLESRLVRIEESLESAVSLLAGLAEQVALIRSSSSSEDRSDAGESFAASEPDWLQNNRVCAESNFWKKWIAYDAAFSIQTITSMS